MNKVYVFPGQGAQQVGMGKDLFSKFPDLVRQADEQLGYSVTKLCLEDAEGKLRQTQYTQPAIYIVNALSYLHKVAETGKKPDFVAGHSLGEYNALFAAGAFDFLTGLQLVQKRGELMGKISGSGMAAVVGIAVDKIREVLQTNGLGTIDIANQNSLMQTVIAGPEADVKKAREIFRKNGARYMILNVSGAFHSRYMEPVRKEFTHFLHNFRFSPLAIPVIANVDARPYSDERIRENLAVQITSPVKWFGIVEYLLTHCDAEFEEVGVGTILTDLIKQIRKELPARKSRSLPLVNSANPLVFMYEGQGSQYYQMGKELYETNAIFRKWMDVGSEMAASELGVSLTEILYRERANRFENFDKTLYTHPAIFLFQYALSQVVLDWRVKPDYLLGYSLGEYVAATISGALSLEEGLRMVICQARLLEELCAPAAIVAILGSPQLMQQAPEIFHGAFLSASNFNNHFTVTGAGATIQGLCEFLTQNKLTFQKLPVNHGFHSTLIDPSQTQFLQHAQSVKCDLPQIPIISSVYVSPITEISPDYLWEVIRRPIEFSKCVAFMEQATGNIYLDLGPSGTLANFVKYNLSATSSATTVCTINRFGNNVKSLRQAQELVNKKRGRIAQNNSE